jgi:hypothetical protein
LQEQSEFTPQLQATSFVHWHVPPDMQLPPFWQKTLSHEWSVWSITSPQSVPVKPSAQLQEAEQPSATQVPPFLQRPDEQGSVALQLPPMS